MLMKNRFFVEGERRKMVSESTKDYFLLDNKIYPINTMTQRAKLQSLKQGIQFQEEKKYIHTPIKKPTAPKINVNQQLSRLTLQQKKQICAEIEQNLNIKSNPFLKKFDAEMKNIMIKIHQQNNNNLKMLRRLEDLGQLSQVECQNKIEFFNKLLLRKQGFIIKINKLFTDIYTKEYKNDKGQITLHELLYSHNSLSQICSLQKIRSQAQIISEKQLLIRQIAQKIDLVGNNSFQFDKNFQKNKPNLQCQEVFSKIPFSIPLIMTKDRKQEIQKQQQITQKRLAECQIQQRIATQLSLLVRVKALDDEMVDTSLANVGNYLASLNSFILQNYFQDIIELINMPYGKPAIQRLSQLQGKKLEQDVLPFILSQKLFEQFEQKLCTNDFQKRHHKVLFDSLNYSLNVYRPYYNFKGQIYPWLVTQKGMTFYSISQSNIEQVLDKCKISIMQKAATLCGILSNDSIHEKAKIVYETKRNEKIQKIVQQEVAEEFAVETEQQQAKIMLTFGQRVLDWLIDQTAHQIKRM